MNLKKVHSSLTPAKVENSPRSHYDPDLNNSVRQSPIENETLIDDDLEDLN